MSIVISYCANGINFIFVVDIRSRLPFFSHSDAPFRFVENVECRLCIVNSAIHSDLYASPNNLIGSVANLRRWTQSLMFTCCLSWELFTILTKIWHNTTYHAVKCSPIHVNSLMTAWKMCTSILFSPVCWKTVRLTKNHMLHHISCNYFGLWGLTVITLTKTTIFHLKIIVQRRSCTLSTRLKMLYTTSYLRTPVDGVASVYRGTVWCFGATLILIETIITP